MDIANIDNIFIVQIIKVFFDFIFSDIFFAKIDINKLFLYDFMNVIFKRYENTPYRKKNLPKLNDCVELYRLCR